MIILIFNMEKLPGIFNDVIGPVMRGPSSSHTAASWRIAKTALDILNDKLDKALIEFDRNGAWASNYLEQGTAMGMNGGLLGLEITDERMKNTEEEAIRRGIAIDYRISSFPASHPNTVRLTLWGVSGKKVQMVAISTGGGSFEIQSVNGFGVKFTGDSFGMIFFLNGDTEIQKVIISKMPRELKFFHEKIDNVIISGCISPQPLQQELIGQLQNHPGIYDFALINPVMPIVTGNQQELPFSSIDSLLDYAGKMDYDLGKLGLLYEKSLSGLQDIELIRMMNSIVQIVHQSIDTGLNGTWSDDRILPQQSHLIGKAEDEGKIKASVMNRMISFVTALMESKSAMEIIVAFPTAGSCGTVGGAVRAVAQNLGSSDEEIVAAYFAAGIVGAYFAAGPGFSAEVHGCQVECGAASGMAAAALVQLMGGTAAQAIGAASMAIQNMIGLVCDPVADRVEVPCLGKNISAAFNAYASAIMSVSGFDAVIPLDQVIKTVEEVSRIMPGCLKCTGKGGLAVTEAALSLKRKLENRSSLKRMAKGSNP
jgi:L-serine dehydratase